MKAFGYERKSADRPDFGQPSYDWNVYRSWLQQYGRRVDPNFNYEAEVGALELSSLCAAVFNWTGIQLPEAPPVIMKPDDKGGTQPDENHPCAELIRRPNPYHIWADYCLAGAISWWLDGNWYMQKVRADLGGQVIELWYLPHHLVEPRWYGDGRQPEVPANEVNDLNRFLSHYQYTVPGRTPTLIPATEMIHIKRGTSLSNPRKGIRAFDPVIKEIFGDNKASAFSANIMKNMGMIQGLISPKDPGVTVTPEAAQHIKEQWIANSTGDNANKPMVNPVALEYTQISFSPKDLDLAELRKVPESRVAAVTGIPAAMLQFLVGLEHGTSFAAYAQAREQGYESVIVPIQKAIAEQLTWQLLRAEFKGSEKSMIEFDTSKVRVLQEDQDSLYKRATAGYLGGWLMRSEARKLASLESQPEDEVFFEPRGSGVLQEGEDPNAITGATTQQGKPQQDKKPLALVPAKAVDLDPYLERLEREMKDFVVKE